MGKLIDDKNFYMKQLNNIGFCPIFKPILVKLSIYFLKLSSKAYLSNIFKIYFTVARFEKNQTFFFLMIFVSCNEILPYSGLCNDRHFPLFFKQCVISASFNIHVIAITPFSRYI